MAVAVVVTAARGCWCAQIWARSPKCRAGCGGEKELQALDILINNAGVFHACRFLEIASDWDFVLDINLKGAFFCAQGRAEHGCGRTPRLDHQLTSGAGTSRGSPRAGVHYLAPARGGRRARRRRLASNWASLRIRVNGDRAWLSDTAQPRYAAARMTETGRRTPTSSPAGRIASPKNSQRQDGLRPPTAPDFITGQVWHVKRGGYLA